MTKALQTRQKLIDRNAKLIRSEIIEIDLGDGESTKIEVRSPTMAQAGLMQDLRHLDTPEGSRAVVKIVIACTFDPESGQPLFSDADEDLLLTSTPVTGGWVAQVFASFGDMVAKAESVAKN